MSSKNGAFASVFNSTGQVLLGHRRDLDLWEAPGGQIESGETPWSAIIREVKEETGLSIQVSRLTGIYYRPSRDNIAYHFACRIVTGKLTLSVDTDKLEFFDIQDLPAHVTPIVRERLSDSRKSGSTIMATQEGLGGRDWLATLQRG